MPLVEPVMSETLPLSGSATGVADAAVAIVIAELQRAQLVIR
jgi:hypothetical protein